MLGVSLPVHLVRPLDQVGKSHHHWTLNTRGLHRIDTDRSEAIDDIDPISRTQLSCTKRLGDGHWPE